MAQLEAAIDVPDGPVRRGRGARGQYVYWITTSHPTDEVVNHLGVQLPGAFAREAFGTLMVQAHAECGASAVETACFLEPHASGKLHHNCLIRCSKQYRWKPVGDKFFVLGQQLPNNDPTIT